MPTGELTRPGHLLCERAQEDILDERRLPGPADARHAHEQPERELDGDVLEVVFASAGQHKRALARRTPDQRQRYHSPPREIRAGNRRVALEQALEVARVDDLP